MLGSTLAALALGLVPFAVTLVQMRVFYAMKDARTPALINAIMVGVRIPLLILCASLDERLIIPGMAVATSISYLVGAIAGEIWLRARYGPMGTRRTLVTLLKMTVAGGAGAAAALLAANRAAAVRGRRSRRGAAGDPAQRHGRAAGHRRGRRVLLKVEELVPLRNRIAGARSRGSCDAVTQPRCVAGTSRTLIVALSRVTHTRLPITRMPDTAGIEQRTMAMTTVIDLRRSASEQQGAGGQPGAQRQRRPGGPRCRPRYR